MGITIDKEQLCDDVFDHLKFVIDRDLNYLSRNHAVLDDNTIQGKPDAFLADARDGNITVTEFQIPSEKFEDYLKKVDYDTNYPEYRKTYSSYDLVKKKALEHFLSLELVDPGNRNCVLDAGGCTSPFGKIATNFFGFSNYYHLDLPRRDLGIKAGVHGNQIGADAASIPLPDESVTFVVSHNAIEHFEGKSYSGFLRESMRILKPGGELVVLPLFFSQKSFAYTSLHRWYQDKRIPSFADKTIILREEIRQPYSRHISIETLKDEFVDDFSNVAEIEIIYFENFRSTQFGFPFALYVRKNSAAE